MIQDDDVYIQTLMKLGLTFLQATIYLTIVKLGKTGVRKISTVSNVARPDVYRIVRTLEKMGVVEKIVSTPTMYEAIPIKEVLAILLQQKIDQNVELQEQTKALITNFQEKNTGAATESEESQFIITSEMKLFVKRSEKDIKEGQMTEDFIGTSEGFSKMLVHNTENFKMIMEKGVKIRAVVEDNVKQESILGIIRQLQRTPLFELRYTSSGALVCMVIIDNKEVDVQISNGPVPSLWSNNPQLVKIAANYFETLWDKAHEDLNSPKIKK